MTLLQKASLAYTLLALTASAYAEPQLTVDDIINKANNVAFYQGSDGRAETRMKIVDSSGREQIRQFTILRKDNDDGGNQQFYVLFQRPSDVKRTAFLVKKNIGGDDDRWLYLPSLDLVKRISAGDKRTSFVGSDFYYEDVSGRALSADTHELLEITDTHYVIDNHPKDPTSVEFNHYKVWINKTTFLPERTEYFDEQDKLFRSVESLEQNTVDGYVTVTKMKVSDLRTGGFTLSEIRFIKYDIGLPDSVFSERSLRSPPQEWLKRPEK